MLIDLLALSDIAPPMGDMSFGSSLSEPRALWTKPLAGEPAEPVNRIIHARTVRLPSPAHLHRFGLRRAPGFHNCGSHKDPDWVTAFLIRARVDGTWQTILQQQNLTNPEHDHLTWFDLPDTLADGVLIELRGSGIDEGWVPWGLAERPCVLEGELAAPLPPPCQRLLHAFGVSIEALPTGVTAELKDGAVCYRTATYMAGFYLSRPGMSFLSLSGEETALFDTNTLMLGAGMFMQGPQLHVIGKMPAMGSVTRFDALGSCRIEGNRVTYDFVAGGQHYVLQWTATPEGLTLEAERHCAEDMEVWHSSVWTIATRNSITPAQAIGRITQTGEAGLMELPVAVNLPRFGTWQFNSNSPAVVCRFDAYRQQDYNQLELKLGEKPLERGTYLLPAGNFQATIEVRPVSPPMQLRDDSPAIARRALHRTYFTALTYRPEMGTLSNNGASMPCAISMDTWTAFYFSLGNPLPNFPAHELIRLSLERWLDGGQSYADGHLVQNGAIRDAQDEYLMTGAAVLRGLADYLSQVAKPAWFHQRLSRMRTRLAAMHARDLDGDGLVESPWRTGISGTGQWGTCWYDVTSFGWKDAFANAILYPALLKLSACFARHGLEAESAELAAWAERLQHNYLATFLNPATGWLAGWRCKADKLHDHAFLMVNGCAITAGLVPPDLARDICARLLAEAKKVGLPKAHYGLPANLWCVPDHDLADIMQGFPFGYYQNGGCSHSQARHFVNALYQCGFTAEADRLLLEMCEGFAAASVFGGNKSGVDWRFWDGRPCGYEGLLTDQFGLLEVLFQRYGRP
ncbi:MAG: hypothetical protein K9M98_14370 [Cephaloticoccus sp.]|nr:hypothetical protein [Cephaloticoccus sp.]MCF7761680.1 hypothetical protein [Cephaloticoccus sp.]